MAVIADTHLPRRRSLPHACLDRMRRADVILHAGDLTSLDALRELESVGPAVEAVHGNVDCAELRRLLPAERTIEAEGARVAVIHDAGPARGRLARLRRRFPNADAVVFGHSHRPLHESEPGFQIFNPGSPTDRRREPRHTMGMGRAREGTVAFDLVALD